MRTKYCKGSAVVDVVLFGCMVVFVLLPLFSLIFEKYLLNETCQRIKDAADMANLAVYYSISTQDLSMTEVNFDRQKAWDVYSGVLAENLRLDSGLVPREVSICDGPVKIEELDLYVSGLPAACSHGIPIDKPSIHSVIDIPVKPSLYSGIVLSVLGREHINLKIHVDSEIPVNR